MVEITNLIKYVFRGFSAFHQNFPHLTVLGGPIHHDCIVQYQKNGTIIMTRSDCMFGERLADRPQHVEAAMSPYQEVMKPLVPFSTCSVAVIATFLPSFPCVKLSAGPSGVCRRVSFPLPPIIQNNKINLNETG